MPEKDAPGGELVLNTTDDGQARIRLRAVDGTASLSQREIAERFGKNVRTIDEHIQNVVAQRRYDEFDVKRRAADAGTADKGDAVMLERLTASIDQSRGGHG